MTIHQAKLWKVVLFTVVAAALLSLASYFYLWNHYYDVLPRSPDPASGRIYADNFHGFVLYETHDEHFRLHVAEDVTLVLIFIAVAAGAIGELKADRN